LWAIVCLVVLFLLVIVLSILLRNRTNGVRVSVHASSAVDRGF